DVLVFHANGTLLPGFPIHLAGLGSGAVPAIADIDLDGRNDIIVASDFWSGVSGYYDKVWAYDLGGPTPHGPIQWGQFMGGPKHDGLYRVVQGANVTLGVSRQGLGSGVVTSSPAGIDCGTDCSETYAAGTVVTLTAAASAFSVTDTVLNQGGVSVASTTTRYYLSLEAAKDGADRLLSGTRGVPTLAASATSSGSRTVTIPSATPLGTYFLLACADDLSQRAERNETNNCRASATTIQVTRPDLLETSVSA